MRFLLIPDPNGASSLPAALEASLRSQNHTVHTLAAVPTKFGFRVALRTLVGSLRTPDLAWVEASARNLAVRRILSRRGIPYILYVDSFLWTELPGPMREMVRMSLQRAVRHAHEVWISKLEHGRRLARTLGYPYASLIPRGVNLKTLPLGDRAEAQSALGLNPHIRWLTLVGPLDATLNLPVLSLAHRQLPGVGLLIAGDGPQSSAVFAMASATRPSSPVIYVGPQNDATTVASICAAEVCISLVPDRMPDIAWTYSALGRRQVSMKHPGLVLLEGLYPNDQTVFETRLNPESLKLSIRSALDAEASSGPLRPDAVQKTRRALDRTNFATRMAEELVRCASFL